MKVTINESRILSKDDYYPFGLTFNSYQKQGIIDQKYKYNGKEQINGLDLNWMDYGARMYDAALGRWHVVDAMADKAHSWTPYRYAFNNPIRITDPDGNFEDDLSGTNEKPTREELRKIWGENKFGAKTIKGGAISIDGSGVTVSGSVGGSSESGDSGYSGAMGYQRASNKAKAESTQNVRGHADWDEIRDGIVITTGGLVSTVLGGAAILTGVGVVPGAVGVIGGIPTMGFGITKIIDGAQGGPSKDKIPGGSFEAIDIGFGGDGSIGQVGDIFSGGLPKNAASGFIMGYGLYNSTYGQALFNSNYPSNSTGNSFGKYIVPADNVIFVIPKRIKE